MEFEDRIQPGRAVPFPKPATFRFLHSPQGHIFARELVASWQQMEVLTERVWLVEALASATASYERWAALVSSPRIAWNFATQFEEAKTWGLDVERLCSASALELLAVVVLAGHHDYCDKACRGKPDYETCFKRCILGAE